MRRGFPGRAGGRGGFALVAALWLLVAISVLGLDFSLRARSRRLATANAVELAQGRAAALAAVEHARARLRRALRGSARVQLGSGPAGVDPWRRPELLFPDTVRLTAAGPWRYRVLIEDTGARLNLNRASEDELRRLLAALRVDYGEADRLAQAIADWRDPDDFRRARGAERAEYLRAGLPVLPANRPFADLSELRQVLGMRPAVFDAVAPYLTLEGTGQVNLAAAERPVLLTLPGIGDEAADAILRRRRAYGRVWGLQELASDLSPGARAALTAAMPALAARAAFETRELLVRGEAWAEGTPVRVHADAYVVRSGSAMYLVWTAVR